MPRDRLSFVEKLLRNDSVALNEERYNEIALQIKQILDFYHEYGIAEDLKVDYTYNENFKVALFCIYKVSMIN